MPLKRHIFAALLAILLLLSASAFAQIDLKLSYTDAKLTGRQEPYFSFLACSDTDGSLRFAKSLKVKGISLSVTQAVLRDDGSSAVYGTAIRSSRSIFRAFKLELNASGQILSRDVRDFTTRADDQYTVRLDPLGNAY